MATVELADIRRAVGPGAGVVRRTPVLVSQTLSERTGVGVVLKAENLQRTGSFKRPGALTMALIRRWVDELLVVSEDEVAKAMVFLMERAKLVVEGRGAVGAAALLAGRCRPAPPGTTAVILSGGNVDAGLLADVTRRHETQAGRRVACWPGCRIAPDRWPCSSRCWRSAAPTCSTCSTSARGSTSTSARARCSSCSRRAGPSTRRWWSRPSAGRPLGAGDPPLRPQTAAERCSRAAAANVAITRLC